MKPRARRSARLTAVSIYLLLAVEAFLFAAFFAVVPDFKHLLELSTFEVGVSLTGLGVAMAVVAIPVGFLVDRLGPRRLTVIGALVLTASAAGHAAAVDVWSLLGARMLLGLASTAILSAGLTWLRDAVPTEQRSVALSAVMPIIGVGSIFGPVVGGVLTDWIGVRVPFAAIAVALVPVVALLLLSPAAPRDRREPPAPPRAAIALVRREPLVLGGCITIVVATLGEGLVNFLAPLQLDGHGISATMIGVFLAVGSIAFVATGAVMARFADWSVRLVVSGVASLVLAGMLIPLIVSDAVAVVAGILIARMAVLGILWTVAFPLGGLGAGRAGLSSGAVFGVLMATIGVSNVAGTLAGAAVADEAGFAAAYGALVGLCLLGALGLLRLAGRPESGRAAAE